MEEVKIFCDKCNKRLDDIEDDKIAYYEVSPIKGISTDITIPLPPELYMDIYRRKHYCRNCYNEPDIKNLKEN
jgi:hypothetical protein